jgi:hypothetical protein
MSEPVDPGVQVYVRHIRNASICMGGARQWFAMRGWSWAEFLVEGRPSADFLATKDPFALRTVAAAVKEASRG